MADEFYILAADIGGTNSRFGLFSVKPRAKHAFPESHLQEELWLPTKEQSSFKELLQAFKAHPTGAKMLSVPPDCAAVAAAGPIIYNCCQPPNIEWDIKLIEFRGELQIQRSALINDFLAQGYACLLNENKRGEELLDIKTIWPVEDVNAYQPTGVVGAGSGFGKALILRDEIRILPSEGGHADFPFITPEEMDFAFFLRNKHKRDDIDLDMVLCGQGFADLFEFYSGVKLTAEQTAELFQSPSGSSSERAALDASLACYARFYGRACKNYILDTMCLGGLYITGGMAMRVPVLEHPDFLVSLHKNEAYCEMLKTVPVYHITSQQAGLRGAALFGALNMKK